MTSACCMQLHQILHKKSGFNISSTLLYHVGCIQALPYLHATDKMDNLLKHSIMNKVIGESHRTSKQKLTELSARSTLHAAIINQTVTHLYMTAKEMQRLVPEETLKGTTKKNRPAQKTNTLHCLLCC